MDLDALLQGHRDAINVRPDFASGHGSLGTLLHFEQTVFEIGIAVLRAPFQRIFVLRRLAADDRVHDALFLQLLESFRGCVAFDHPFVFGRIAQQ